MDRFENPYRPGAGSAPPALVGRDDLIGDFEITMRRALDRRPGKSCVLLGLRGVGKTVLLNRFSRIAEQQGVKVGFIEASEGRGFPELLAVRLRRILLDLEQGAARRALSAVRRALSVLASFTHTFADGSSVAVSLEPLAGQADSGVFSEDLTDLLVAVGEAADTCESGLLLAIDELQYLTDEELAAVVGATHRSVQLDLPVVVAGAGLPQVPALLGNARTYAERLFQFPEIGRLDEDDAAAAIVLPAVDLGVEIEEAAVRRIIEESGSYPYFLQEWSYHAWNAAPASPITDDDARSAKASVVDKLDRDFFRVRYDRLTPKESEYLRAMAELGPGPHRSGDIAEVLGVQVTSVAPRRSALIAKGMIYSPSHGDTAFTVPLFDEFIKRAAH
ncbi:ATP-binding protein [Candidatus Poriferisocius sp.]|uniref:ATP-binding protein n=1 Tax=Candidatus Poriferisocius sp. TaxID=3101276 RepID=UPI003B01734A